ncbi:MAG: carbohydrate porin, partial [Candidatus Omnitrophica bacterium]|nr:carbohydrate porin [Candidatus Omnitrophota bacterium]
DGDSGSDPEDLFNTPFIAFQTNFIGGLFNRPGNYRIYGWKNMTEHTKWIDSGSSENTGYGFGISFDQELTDIVGVFARFGWQNPEVYLAGESFSLESSWSIGAQMGGEPWGRENDIFAIAFGQAIPSDDYKDAGANLKADPESHLEAYYSIQLNDHLTLSPDIQIIWNPYGGDAALGDKAIFVGGARAQIDF